MSKLRSDVRRRVLTGDLADSLRSNFTARPTVKTGLGGGDGLLFVDTQIQKSTHEIAAGETVRVVNVGRPGAAIYAPERSGEGGIVSARPSPGGGPGGSPGGPGTIYTAGHGIRISSFIISAEPDDFTDVGRGLTVQSGRIGINLPSNSGLEFDSAGALKVRAGLGIQLESNNVRVRLQSPSGLELTALDGLAVAQELAGPGLAMTSKVLRVNTAFNFTWTGLHVFQQDVKIAADLIFQGQTGSTGGRWIKTESNRHLFLEPHGTGTVMLPEGKHIGSQFHDPGFLGRGWSITTPGPGHPEHGKSHLDIRSIYAEELKVHTFIADFIRAMAGERFLGQSLGIVADVMLPSGGDLVKWEFEIPPVNSSTKIYVEDLPQFPAAVFGDGDIVLITFLDRKDGGLEYGRIYGEVTNYNAEDLIPDIHSYTFTTRNAPGFLIGSIIPTGTIMIDMGQSGDSFIHESVTDNFAPFTRYRSWTGNPWTPANISTHVQVGNLDGLTMAHPELSPSGFGLFGENVFLKGKLQTANTLVDNSGITVTHASSASGVTGDGLKLRRSLDDTTHAAIVGFHHNVSPFTIHSLMLLSGAHPNYSTTNGPQNLGHHSIILAAGGETSFVPRINLTTYNPNASADSQANEARITLASGIAGLGYNSAKTVSSVDIIARNITLLALGEQPADIRAQHFSPLVDNLYDLGTSVRWWRRIYVKEIVADIITGEDALGGQVWQYDAGDMFIRSSSASARTLTIHNPGAGTMNVVVEGTVEAATFNGVDIGSFFATYSSHAANANAHHARIHALDSTDDHSGSLSWSRLSKTGSSLADLATRAHAALTDRDADDHSQYVHVSVQRTIVARHIFNPGSALAPFILHSNAQSQTVVGLRADELNKSITAGAGLTGGGVLTATRTLAVDLAHAFTWTAQHTYSPASAQPPFVLSANAQGQTVIGFRADQVSKIVIAGIGLSGGGELTANRTLSVNLAYAFEWETQHTWNTGSAQPPFVLAAINRGQTVTGFRADELSKSVGAGTGLVGGGVLTQNRVLAVDMAHAFNWTGQHTYSPSAAQPPFVLSANAQSQTVVGFRADQLNKQVIAGAGLVDGGFLTDHVEVALGLPGSLSAASINSVSPTSHYHFIATTDDSSLHPETILITDEAGHLRLVKLHTPSIGSPTYLELVPDGNVIIDPTGNQMLPGGNIRVDLGAYNRKWARVYAEELIVSHLVQREVFATLGGSITVNPTTSLIADVDDTQGTIDVKDNIFLNGMYLKLNSLNSLGLGQSEFMRVTSSGTAITDGYRYSVERGLSPLSAKEWAAGDAVISLGAAFGDGWIELVSESTTLGQDGPNMTVYTRTGISEWSDVVPVVTVGNLRGLVDYGSNRFGIGIGNDLTLTPTTGFSGITGDPVDGLRMFNVNSEWHDSIGRLAMDMGISHGIRALSYDGLGGVGFNGIAWYEGSINGGALFGGIFPNRTTALGDREELSISLNPTTITKHSDLRIRSRTVSPDHEARIILEVVRDPAGGGGAAAFMNLFVQSDGMSILTGAFDLLNLAHVPTIMHMVTGAHSYAIYIGADFGKSSGVVRNLIESQTNDFSLPMRFSLSMNGGAAGPARVVLDVEEGQLHLQESGNHTAVGGALTVGGALAVQGSLASLHGSLAVGGDFTPNSFRVIHARVGGPTGIRVENTSDSVIADLIAGSVGGVGTQTNHDFALRTNGTNRVTVAAGGDTTIHHNLTVEGVSTLSDIRGPAHRIISWNPGFTIPQNGKWRIDIVRNINGRTARIELDLLVSRSGAASVWGYAHVEINVSMRDGNVPWATRFQVLHDGAGNTFCTVTGITGGVRIEFGSNNFGNEINNARAVMKVFGENPAAYLITESSLSN